MSGAIQAATNYLQSFKAGFEDRYTRFVDWTSAHSVDIQGTLKLNVELNDSDSATRKTIRVFLGCVVSLALLPFSCLGVGLSYAAGACKAVKDFIGSKMPACKGSQESELIMKRASDVAVEG